MGLTPVATPSTPLLDVCARCGEACEADALVCTRCSETRIRAALPAEGMPPSVEEVSLDELLARAEAESGETAHHVVASIDGALGGEVKVSISIVTAQEGPATPLEEIWSTPVALTTLACGSSEVAAARLSWVERITEVRGLQAPELTRRLRVGTRGYRGEASAVGMLLDARLHMARRALERDQEPTPQTCSIIDEGDIMCVHADFTNKGAIELFFVKAPSEELRAAVKLWIDAQH